MRVIKAVLGPVFPKGQPRMDAYLADAAKPSNFDGPPILIAATSDKAMAQARCTIEALGLRIGVMVPIESASERLEMQGRAAALWIEIDRDAGRAMDELLDVAARETREGRYATIISTTSDILDVVAGHFDSDGVELIVDADEAERAAAIAIATARRRIAVAVHDIASDKSAERLRQLSDEVSRIASTLARLSAGPGNPQPTDRGAPPGEAPTVSPETVRSVIRARRLRARYFSEDLFADPAWDMLLDLLQAEIAQLRVPVSSLCIAAAVPATTALRWLKTMVSQGLFIRRSDPRDGRRVFVELAPETSHALRMYFAEVGPVAVI